MLLQNREWRKGRKVYVGGNIGAPLLPLVEAMTTEDYAVVELSSFQLHTMKKSPDISVITNITPNHLDMHKSYEEYIDAKKNIMLMSHHDVVEGSDEWETDPFCAAEKDGYLYGRGTIDTKTPLFALQYVTTPLPLRIHSAFAPLG